MTKLYEKSIRKKIQFIFNYGYPPLENYMESNYIKVNISHVVWTPRWSMNRLLGEVAFLSIKEFYR